MPPVHHESKHSDKFFHTDASTSSQRSNSKRSKPKKASHACTACRRQKSRCEILGVEDGRLRCHRCKVLGNICSYETSDKSLLRDFKSATAREAGSSSPQPPDNTEAPMGVIYFSGDAHYRKRYIGTRRPSISQWNVIVSSSGEHEWSVAPILAVHNIASSQMSSTPPRSSSTSILSSTQDATLSEVLSLEQIQHLTYVFEHRFLPWLNLPSAVTNLGACQKQAPFLELVCCTIAARYLEGKLCSTLLPRLHKLLEHDVVQQMVEPVPSVELVLSFLILALWGNNCQIVPDTPSMSQEAFTTTQLLQTAANLAITLDFNHASSKCLTLADERTENGGSLSPAKQQEYQTLLNHAHIWLSITNTESILCLGTGSLPTTKRSSFDRRLVNIPASATGACVRELRLGLLAELFDIVEQGMQLRLTNADMLQDWSDEISEVLLKLARMDRIIAPLPVLLDQESFHFYITRVYYSIVRVTFLYYAQGQCRHLCSYNTNEIQHKPWHKGFSSTGVHFFATWSQDAVSCAESLLLHLASAAKLPSSPSPYPNQNLLTSAPDRIFCMATFSATLLVMSKFWSAENAGIEFVGATDGLLTRAITVLEQSSLFAEDHAQKCAKWIQRMITAWENRDQEDNTPPNDITHTSSPYSPAPTIEPGPSEVQWYPSPAATTSSSDCASPHPQDLQVTFQPQRSSGAPTDMYVEHNFWNMLNTSMEVQSGQLWSSR
jgi:hypothetical protein